jgi:hypothetical protein
MSVLLSSDKLFWGFLSVILDKSDFGFWIGTAEEEASIWNRRCTQRCEAATKTKKKKLWITNVANGRANATNGKEEAGITDVTNGTNHTNAASSTLFPREEETLEHELHEQTSLIFIIPAKAGIYFTTKSYADVFLKIAT